MLDIGEFPLVGFGRLRRRLHGPASMWDLRTEEEEEGQ